MTIDKVLEAMPTETFQPSWYYDLGAMMIVTVIVMVAFIPVFSYFKYGNPNSDFVVTKLSIWGFVILIVFGVVLLFQMERAITGISEHKEEKRKWEREYVEEYIEQQPEIKVRVVNQIEVKEESNKYANVTFSRGGEVVEITGVDVVLDLETLEDPYITYRELTEEIGWIEAGYYQYKLHLPKDYQF